MGSSCHAMWNLLKSFTSVLRQCVYLYVYNMWTHMHAYTHMHVHRHTCMNAHTCIQKDLWVLTVK